MLNNPLQSTHPRLWEDFLRVDPAEPESIRAFCFDRHRFMLPTSRPWPEPYVPVSSPNAIRKFRRIHGDFVRNVEPVGRAYLEAMVELSEFPPRPKLLAEASGLADELVVQSINWLESLRPMVSVEPKGLPELKFAFVATDPDGGPHVKPEGLTMVTPGLVFLDFLYSILEGIKGQSTFLECANCGKSFLSNAWQRGHKDLREHRVWCITCAGTPRERKRLWMVHYRMDRKKSKGGRV